MDWFKLHVSNGRFLQNALIHGKEKFWINISLKLLALVVQSPSHVQLCDLMDCSMPGFSVLHHFPEFAQTNVHWVEDALQPSHPLLPLSPPALSLSQHQGLFQWVTSSHHVAKYWSFSFSISPSNKYSDWFPLGLTGLISLLSKGLSRVFSSTTVQRHHFLCMW